MTRQTRYGTQLPRVRSEMTVIVVEPSGGLRGDIAPTNLPMGANPQFFSGADQSQNMVFRNGGVQLRPLLSSHTSNSNPIGFVTGGAEIESSVASQFQVASGTTRFAYYSAGSWSPLSYVSAFGNSAPPSITTYERTKFVQIYEPRVDNMIAVASVTSSYQTLFSWQAGATVFSALTSAPKARWVDAFDNFLIGGNIRDSSGSKYVQRIQWSDRGNPSNWTTGLSGFQDLLDARGQIQQVAVQENRIIVFLDQEIWVGVRDAFPNIFRFSVLDRSVGTRFGMTVANTPAGVMFLGQDFMVYLLPKEGGAAVPVGQAIHANLQFLTLYGQGTNAAPWAVYDQTLQVYQLYVPQGSIVDIANTRYDYHTTRGEWRYHALGDEETVLEATIGWPARHAPLTGGAETWSSLSGIYTWATIPFTWQQTLLTQGIVRPTTLVGLSSGSIAYYQDFGVVENVADGVASSNLTVVGKWRSKELGGDNPETLKCVTGFRVDYQNVTPSSSVSVRFIGQDPLAPIAHSSSISLELTRTPQVGAQAFPYVATQYPQFEVALASPGVTLFRFWVSMRMGGRPNA